MIQNNEQIYTEHQTAMFDTISLIAERIVNQAKFDSTILCTITDDSKREQGEYQCTDGSIIFTAYTTDKNIKYYKNTSVYVMIPQGDHNNKKIIVGKYIDENDDSYYNQYQSPLEQFVNVKTFNILPQNENETKDNFTGLIANGQNKTKIINVLKTDNAEKPITFKGYSALGLTAEFKTNLQGFNVSKGTYGLTINCIDNKGNVLKSYGFSNDNMFGNTFNFNAFIKQEGLFDISDISDEITEIVIVFRQEGNFYDSNNKLIPPYGLEEQEKEMVDNLWVQNISLSFGYHLKDFNEETVLLKTNNNLFTTEDRQRTLNAYWVVEDSHGNLNAIETEEELENKYKNAQVHWYQKDLTKSEIDDLAGIGWTEIDFDEKKYSMSFTTDSNIISEKSQIEQFKVIIENPSREAQQELAEKDNRWPKDDNTSLSEEEKEKLKNSILNEYLNEVQYYHSNILYLYNQLALEDVGINLLQNINLDCDTEGYNGTYFIYNGFDKKIMRAADAYIKRELKLNYISVHSGLKEFDYSDTTEAKGALETITWKIPQNNTMIASLVEGVDYNIKNNEGIVVSDDVKTEDGFIIITRTRYRDISENKDENVILTQSFKIKDTYNPEATNNTIYVEITRKGINEQIHRENTKVSLSFGERGNSGTDYSLILECMNESKHGFIYVANKEEAEVKLIGKVLNDRGEEITDISIDYSLYLKDEELNEIVSLNSEENRCIIKCNLKRWSSELDIIPAVCIQAKAKVSGINDKDDNIILTSYYTIPFFVTQDKEFNDIIYDGINQIIYNSFGNNPIYNKKYITLNKLKSDNTLEKFDFSLFNKDNFSILKNKDYEFRFNILTNTSQIQLIGPNMYLSNVPVLPIIKIEDKNNGWRFYQPIVILQDTWDNPIINDWNGKFKIDQEGNGILSSFFVAGSKNNSNQFTGVVGGIIETDKTNSEGIFGYRDGVQSFGFNVNGTAFIGESGKGRIEFDGTKSIIKSSDNNGMEIDLNKGIIKTKKFVLEAGEGINKQIKIDTTPENIPLQLGNKFSVDWDGTINAAAGTIGKWNLDTDDTNSYSKLYASPTSWSYGTGIAAGNNIAFWAGFQPKNYYQEVNDKYYKKEDLGINEDGSYYVLEGKNPVNIDDIQHPWNDNNFTEYTNFYVTHDGILNAKGATIEGKIVATSGEIGGVEIIDGKLQVDQIKVDEIIITPDQIKDSGKNYATYSIIEGNIGKVIQSGYGWMEPLKIRNNTIYTVNQWLTDNDTKRTAYTAGISPCFSNGLGRKIFLWAGFNRTWDAINEDDWADNIFGNLDWNDAYDWITEKNAGGSCNFYVTHLGEMHATGAYINGNINVTGEGNIGMWKIKPVYKNGNNIITSALYSCNFFGSDTVSSGIAGHTTTANSVFLWAGFNPRKYYNDSDNEYETPWDDPDYNKYTDFYVTTNGTVYCKKLVVPLAETTEQASNVSFVMSLDDSKELRVYGIDLVNKKIGQYINTKGTTSSNGVNVTVLGVVDSGKTNNGMTEGTLVRIPIDQLKTKLSNA